ncbi:MAG: HD domain-containing protein [bacterium]
MKSIVNFLFEIGMLKKTPRSGYFFLGSGEESVAEHVMRMTSIGYVMAKLDPQADECKLIKMCLVHDLAEARTGDHNYVHKRYVTVDEEKATRDLAADLSFGPEITALSKEFNEGCTREAQLANDADQIEHILQLKECMDLGSPHAADWIRNAQKRIRTAIGRTLVEAILETNTMDWWFQDKDDEWWVNGGKNR